MHITRTIRLSGTSAQAMTKIMEKMMELHWDIQSAAPLWARANTGEWWEKKVEVEILVSSGWPSPSVMIDAEPISSLPYGPAWDKAVNSAVDRLIEALGVHKVEISDRTIAPMKIPLTQSRWEPNEWRDMQEAADRYAPYPAPLTNKQTLAMTAREPGGGGVGGAAAGGGGGVAIGELVKWVVKQVGSALIAIGVQDALDHRDDERTAKGKLEYQLASNQMVIKWEDGSYSLAPKEYQPHY